jgi:hypothetical protein
VTYRALPKARWVQLAAAALVVMTVAQNGDVSSMVAAVGVLLLLLAGAAAFTAALAVPLVVPRSGILGAVTCALTVPTAVILGQLLAPSSGVGRLVILVLVVLGAGAVVAAPSAWLLFSRWPRASTAVYVGTMCGLLAAAVAVLHLRIDVHVFLTDGVRALLNGENPYTVTFPNVYSPTDSAGFYGTGVVVADHLAYGYPYLPGTLFGAVPGYLLGDVRLSGVLLLGLLAVLVVLTTPDLRSRFVAVMLIGAPVVASVVFRSWTETVQVAVFGFAVVALERRRLLAAAVLLGLGLTTKQYLVVTLPALWLLRGVFGRREWLTLFGTAFVVTVPFVLADPREFWRAVVEWQLIQPFRPESLSLLALSVNQIGWPPPAVFGLLPVGVGVAVALLLAWRLSPGTSAFLLTMGLALLATVLLSKQAFVNYYLFVGGCLLLAAWTSTDTDPVFRFRSRLLPRGVAEVGDVGRETRVHAQPQRQVDRGEVGQGHLPGQAFQWVPGLCRVLTHLHARVPSRAGDGVGERLGATVDRVRPAVAQEQEPQLRRWRPVEIGVREDVGVARHTGGRPGVRERSVEARHHL